MEAYAASQLGIAEPLDNHEDKKSKISRLEKANMDNIA